VIRGERILKEVIEGRMEGKEEDRKTTKRDVG